MTTQKFKEFYQPFDGRIKVVAPSSPFDQPALIQGIKLLRDKSMEAEWCPSIFEREGYLAGDDINREHQLARALNENDPVTVWAAAGGYGAGRIAQQFAQAAPPGRPRWLVGYSDITVLHMLWRRWGWLSIHGANISSLPKWGKAQVTQLLGQLKGELGCDLPARWLCGPKHKISGPLLGGNLTVLASMLGNGWLPSFKGAILLLEDIDERPYRLDRSLTQLLNSGHFEDLAGIVIGQLTNCVEAANRAPTPTALEVFEERLRNLGVPVMCDLPVGHDTDSWSVIHGWSASLDPEGGKVTQTAVRSSSGAAGWASGS